MDTHKQVVEAVLNNLEGRAGFDHWWYDVDHHIREEIVETLEAIVAPIILTGIHQATRAAVDHQIAKDWGR